jgi:hypothetical protein
MLDTMDRLICSGCSPAIRHSAGFRTMMAAGHPGCPAHPTAVAAATAHRLEPGKCSGSGWCREPRRRPESSHGHLARGYQQVQGRPSSLPGPRARAGRGTGCRRHTLPAISMTGALLPVMTIRHAVGAFGSRGSVSVQPLGGVESRDAWRLPYVAASLAAPRLSRSCRPCCRQVAATVSSRSTNRPPAAPPSRSSPGARAPRSAGRAPTQCWSARRLDPHSVRSASIRGLHCSAPHRPLDRHPSLVPTQNVTSPPPGRVGWSNQGSRRRRMLRSPHGVLPPERRSRLQAWC